MSRLEKSLSTKKKTKLYLPSLFVISWPKSANNLYSYHLHISCSVCNCCAFTIIEKVRFLCLLWKKMMIPKIMRIWKVLLLKSRFSPNSQLDTFYKRSTLNILVWKLCHQSHSLLRKKKPEPFLSYILTSSWQNGIDTSPRNQLSVESRGFKEVFINKQRKLLYSKHKCVKKVEKYRFFSVNLWKWSFSID